MLRDKFQQVAFLIIIQSSTQESMDKQEDLRQLEVEDTLIMPKMKLPEEKATVT